MIFVIVGIATAPKAPTPQAPQPIGVTATPAPNKPKIQEGADNVLSIIAKPPAIEAPLPIQADIVDFISSFDSYAF